MVETYELTVTTAIKTEALFTEPHSKTPHYYELSVKVNDDGSHSTPELLRVDENENLLSAIRHQDYIDFNDLLLVIDGFMKKNIITDKEHWELLTGAFFDDEYGALLALLQKGKSLSFF